MYKQHYRSATQKALDAGVFVITDILRLKHRRTAFILAHRIGITNATKWTLEELANQLSVTKERIRQIEAKGLMQIRNVGRVA